MYLGLRRRATAADSPYMPFSKIPVPVLACVLCAGVALPTNAHGADAQRVVLSPVADTYVRADARTAHLGSSRTFSVRGGRRARRAYLRFQVSVPPGQVVQRATLRLYALSPGRRAASSPSRRQVVPAHERLEHPDTGGPADPSRQRCDGLSVPR